MVHKVAIIIPTKNRADFLIRQLKYYASVKSKHPIYIGDSSNRKNKKKILQEINYLRKKININYLYFPKKNGTQVIEAVSKKVREKYCAYNGDDDFLIPKSLSKCANFLDKNKTFRTAQGLALIFSLKKKNNAVYGEFSWLDRYTKNPQALNNSAKKRFINLIKNYWVCEPSVHRHKEWIEDIKNIEKINDYNFAEYKRCFATITNGKSKYIDCLYLLRQAHDNRHTLPHYNIIKNSKWKNSYRIFNYSIAKILNKKDGLELDIAKKIVDKYFKIYILPKHKFSINKVSKKNSFKHYLQNKIPYKTIDIFRKVKNTITMSNKPILFDLTKKYSKYYNDFFPLYVRITKRD